MAGEQEGNRALSRAGSSGNYARDGERRLQRTAGVKRRTGSWGTE